MILPAPKLLGTGGFDTLIRLDGKYRRPSQQEGLNNHDGCGIIMQSSPQGFIEERMAWVAPVGDCSHCEPSKSGQNWWDECPHYGGSKEIRKRCKKNPFYHKFSGEEFLRKYREEIVIPYIDKYEPQEINGISVICLNADRHPEHGIFNPELHVRSIPVYPGLYSIGSIDILVDHCIFVLRYLMEEFSTTYPNAKLVFSVGSGATPCFAVVHAFSALRDEYTSLNWDLYELHVDNNRKSEEHRSSDGEKGYHMMENIVNNYRQLLKEKDENIASLKSKIDWIKSICDKGPNASLRYVQIKQICND